MTQTSTATKTTALNTNQITALRTHTTRNHGILVGNLRTLRSLESRGLAVVLEGHWNIYRINEAGLAALAELDARDAARQADLAREHELVCTGC